MKFKLHQLKSWCNDKEKRELEKLGFYFEREKNTSWGEWHYCREKDPKIEINTLEELIIFTKKWGSIILTEDQIEIYNDYSE